MKLVRWRRSVGPSVVLLAAGIAVLPLIWRGPSCGHDFDFHLVSWFDCLNSWRQGILYPHWTPSANYGAGEPRFVFYSPLTWMLGAALGVVTPWHLVPLALTFLLLAGTGLATRALARQSLDNGAATLAGCVAIFSGYALFTAYERTAFAELAGGFWIPLVLLFLLREKKSPDSDTQAARKIEFSGIIGEKHPAGAKALADSINFTRGLKPPSPFDVSLSAPCSATPIWRSVCDHSTALLAVAVAGAWLSNPTVGVMACYLLVAVALTHALLTRSWAVVLRVSIGAALGMGLVGDYLLPAAWERRWVDILQVTEDPGQMLENNWLFAVHHNATLALHDEVLHTVSIIVVVMVAMALSSLLLAGLRGRLPGERRWWIPLALIPLAVLFLQFPVSHPLWNLLPELRFLQFPWRWLVVLEAPMAIFFASAVWPGNTARRWRRVAVGGCCVAVFLAMTACANREFFQVCDDDDSVSGMLNNYLARQGFIGTYEYEPVGGDLSLIATGLPDACLVSDPATELGIAAQSSDSPPVWEAGQGSCESTFAASRKEAEHLRIAASAPHTGFLILRLRSYPAWRVAVNGQPVSELPRRDDGLIAVPVPQGPIDLTVDWTTTLDVLAGRWLSGLAALLLGALWLVERKLRRPHLS